MSFRTPLDDKVESLFESFVEDLKASLAGPKRELSEAELIEEATFGSECMAMLESRAYRLFMLKQEARLTEELLALPLKADDERKRLAIAVQTLRALKDFLLRSAQAGRQAEARLGELRDGPKKRPFF